MEAATSQEEIQGESARSQAAPPPRLRERYEAEVLPNLKEKFGHTTPMSVPRLLKVSVNMGIGEASRTGSVVDDAIEELAAITGQRPNLRRARRSIAAFKIRDGMPVGVAVTLRRARMWEFTDRLVSISIPRIRDFRGLDPRGFDGRGNYSMGVREQLIFPEIDYDSVSETRGLDISFVTSAVDDEQGFELLLGLGFPFAEEGRPGAKSAAAAAAEAEAEQARKEEARQRAEAEQAALEQLKEENPDAYETPEPKGDEGEGESGEEEE